MYLDSDTPKARPLIFGNTNERPKPPTSQIGSRV